MEGTFNISPIIVLFVSTLTFVLCKMRTIDTYMESSNKDFERKRKLHNRCEFGMLLSLFIMTVSLIISIYEIWLLLNQLNTNG